MNTMKAMFLFGMTSAATLSSGVCRNTNNGALDRYKDDCEAYVIRPDWSGRWDDDDFSSMDMCCACGGGADPSFT